MSTSRSSQRTEYPQSSLSSEYPLEPTSTHSRENSRGYNLNDLYNDVLSASAPPLRHLASNSTLRTQTSSNSQNRSTSRQRGRTYKGKEKEWPFRPLSTTFEGQRHPGKPSVSITRSTKIFDPLNEDAKAEERMSSMSTIGAEKDKEAGLLEASPPSPQLPPAGIPEEEVLESIEIENEDTGNYPGPIPLAILITGICLSVFLISLDRTIITTAIPYITSEFQSSADIGWYGSSYLLTASAFQPLYGRIFMLFNIKWSYIAATTLFEIGSLICGIAPNSLALIIGRAIQGLGSAGILTGSFVVVAHSVPLQKRPVWTAVVGLMFGVGATVGPLLGGVFTDLVTWRWCFYFNLPVGGATILAMITFFQPAKTEKSEVQQRNFFYRVVELDLVGNVILLGASIMLFLALEFTNQQVPWASSEIIGLLVGSGMTFIMFSVWQWWKADGALMPPRILCHRTISASCAVGFFIYATILIQSYYLPIWFQAVKGDSAIHSGVNMIPYVVANAIFSLLAGIFVSKNGYFTGPAILGCAIGTVGCGLLSTLRVDTPSSLWIGYEFLTSAGIGMAIQQGFTAVQSVLPLEEIPIGTAAVVAFQSLGGAIFVSVGNTILQGHLLSASDNNALPGVDMQAVIDKGAAEFRPLVPDLELPAVLEVYNKGLQTVLTAAIPLCGLAFVSALFMEWRSVNGKTKVNQEADEEAAAPVVEKNKPWRSSALTQCDVDENIPETLLEHRKEEL